MSSSNPYIARDIPIQDYSVHPIEAFYSKAFEYAISHDFEGRPFLEHIEWQRKIRFEIITDRTFFWEYVWVVLASGFKVAIARPYYERLYNSAKGTPENADTSIIYKNKRKRFAVDYMIADYQRQFHELNKAKDKLSFLETLPFIGPVTKYHLAKNLGLDYAKPDVHLQRLCKKFGFKDAQSLCEYVSNKTLERISVVDLVLWFYCSENPDYRDF